MQIAYLDQTNNRTNRAIFNYIMFCFKFLKEMMVVYIDHKMNHRNYSFIRLLIVLLDYQYLLKILLQLIFLKVTCLYNLIYLSAFLLLIMKAPYYPKNNLFIPHNT